MKTEKQLAKLKKKIENNLKVIDQCTAEIKKGNRVDMYSTMARNELKSYTRNVKLYNKHKV